MCVMLRVTLSAFLGIGLFSGGSAMGLAEVIRGGVRIANGITSGLQVVVEHEAWVGQDSYGKPQFATAVARPALVEAKQRMRRMTNGQEVLQLASITFLQMPEANGAEGRREPIDPRDRLTLPDGITGPIIDVSGMTDPGTDAAYLLEVALAAVQ